MNANERDVRGYRVFWASLPTSAKTLSTSCQSASGWAVWASRDVARHVRFVSTACNVADLAPRGVLFLISFVSLVTSARGISVPPAAWINHDSQS